MHVQRPVAFVGLAGLCLAGAKPYCAFIYRITRTYVLRYETIATCLVLWMLYLYLRWYSDSVRSPEHAKRPPPAAAPGVTPHSWQFPTVPGLSTVLAATLSPLFGAGGEHVEALRRLKEALGGVLADGTVRRRSFAGTVRQAPSKSWQSAGDEWALYARMGARLSMEDRFDALRAGQFAFYAVYDGHGGEHVASFLEEHCGPAALLRYTELRPEWERHRWGAVMGEQIEALDSMCMASAPRAAYYAGSTLLAASIVDGRHLSVFNVGDSRAILVDGRGNATQLSVDHKPNLPLERSRIERAGGFVAFNGVWRVLGILATSRAIGDAFLKRTGPEVVSARPDAHYVDLANGRYKYLILASDGLWDVFSNQDAAELVHRQVSSTPASMHMSIQGERLFDPADSGSSHKSAPLQAAARALVDAAIQRGSMDNVSVLIVDLENA